MSSSGSIWYFALDDERVGPRTLEEMRELAAAGVIGPATLVWTQGMAEWTTASAFPILTQPAAEPEPPVEPPTLPQAAPAQRPREQSAPPALYAWSRWLARSLDISLALLALLAATGTDMSRLDPQQLSPFMNVAAVALWVPIDALLLSLLGTTPGKALFGIRVSTGDGARPSFGTAFARALRVSVQGMALGIPLVILAAEALSYARLTRTGVTPWDEALALRVEHTRLGPVRSLLVILLLVGMIAALVVAAGGMG